ncbi:MAG TPA: carbamoyl-phosphate synthase large subunit, partial [bacterium]|nr:carbamoyl-phosphate synthase large subunit [bacterium]
MPKRTDIKSIAIIGSGPIIIGQGPEFDYSGTQGCRALKRLGYRVVLVNSNPATIMTDPEFADATYIEPITPEAVTMILERERPDALLPTLGGQTALNTAVALAENGTLERLGIELIGANLEAIRKAEDRQAFKEAMRKIGMDLPRSAYVTSFEQAMAAAKDVGYPAIIRPSFTLGGTGGNIAYNHEEYEQYVLWGLAASPRHEILVEESIIGWKEFELEVMRDKNDNVVIVCSIENLDPMGVHTGDSITVAPIQTLTDREYQKMRDAAIAIIREIGVDTGGCNIQFAVDPVTGRQVVIEMNPRVSRSSALASKATGYPIASIAAQVAVGFTLDEITNEITGNTPVSFEPTIDYVVTKIPRFAFEKFPEANNELFTQMKSVGEAMSIGRTFEESLQKALRSLEIDRYGLEEKIKLSEWRVRRRAGLEDVPPRLEERLRHPTPGRPWYIAEAFRAGMTMERVHELTGIDPWFLQAFKRIVSFEQSVMRAGSAENKKEAVTALLRDAKQLGFADRRLAALAGLTEEEILSLRKEAGITPVYKTVDTCAAEFESSTPYHYSTYDGTENEVRPSTKRKVMILGGGPNRIGQGIEFDYCCVHASFTLREQGFETIMVNCNPETVSTDWATSDRLYFEPLTREDVLAIVEQEKPEGVIVQFGGQTPLKLASYLAEKGIPILGTQPDAIDLAEDRERFKALLDKVGIKQPPSGTARSKDEALQVAARLGYPCLVRPSYVLGGRAMKIVYDPQALEAHLEAALEVSNEKPILVDGFLEDAIEVDVDAIGDGDEVIVAGVMEQIQEAGVHSGDSACALPPYSLEPAIVEEIKRQTVVLGKALKVRGLMNVQFAIKGNDPRTSVYVLEVNPRASRTVPFVSKATGIPLAKLAARVMVGMTLREVGLAPDLAAF